MDIIIQEKVLTANCDCCCGLNTKIKDCTLFEIEVKEVFLQRDTSVFRSSEEVKSLKYLIIPDTFDRIKILPNKPFSVFAYSTCSKEILVVNQLLSKRPKSVSSYSGLAFVGDLALCPKFNFWQRIFIFLGINKDKIYSKAKKVPIKHSDFVTAVKERTN